MNGAAKSNACRQSEHTRPQALHSPKLAALTLIMVAGVWSLLPAPARAEGLRNPPPGTFNLGRAGGRIAQIDDSSAITQNPANLMDVAHPEVQFTPTVVYLKADYDSPSGMSAHTKDPWHVLPNLFASLPLRDGEYSLGLGVTTPYGLASKWDESGAFSRSGGNLRYASAYLADLKTVNINPTVAVRPYKRLSVGVGFDVFWSELTLKQFYPWFLVTANPADPDGVAKAKGDGVGFGGNVGATWEVTDRQRFAVTYRSPVRVGYDGDFTVNNIPSTVPGISARSDFKSHIEFPTIVGAGYGLQLTDSIRVEVDVEWLEFSNFDTLPLDTKSAPPGIPSRVRQDWKNTFTAGVGGDWKFATGWVLRGGYQFYESPVPDRTFSPSIPDANQHVFTIGLGYRHGRHSLEVAYGLDFYDKRTITDNQTPAFNGTYNITVHLFSCAYGYAF